MRRHPYFLSNRSRCRSFPRLSLHKQRGKRCGTLALIHDIVHIRDMDVTPYFERNVLDNPDRSGITKVMCEEVVANPEYSETQADGRTIYWQRPGSRDLYLRVVVTADGTALHNAFFDSNYTRKQRRDE